MSLVQLGTHALDPRTAPPFPEAAKADLRDTQLRRNVARATDTIQRKRAALVEEKTDWQGAGRGGGRGHPSRVSDEPRPLPARVRGTFSGGRRNGALGCKRRRGEPDRPRPLAAERRERGNQ